MGDTLLGGEEGGYMSEGGDGQGGHWIGVMAQELEATSEHI